MLDITIIILKKCRNTRYLRKYLHDRDFFCIFANEYNFNVAMGKKEKLVERLKRLSKDFTYNEAMALLLAIGFVEDNKGGTSGFRVLFRKDGIGQALMFHKPHPQKELKPYVVKMISDYLIRHNQI